jgi:transcriptional regulator with XRE-family HTH domain
MDDLLQIGRWVESQRKARQWSRPQLAARAGVAENTVYLLENGANTRVGTMLSVLHVFNARFKIHASTQDIG